VEEGRVELHRDINDYLRSWKFPYDSTTHNKTITLAHLLSHTAGLTVHGLPGYPSTTDPPLTEILNGLPPAVNDPVRSEKEPGAGYEYSGGGTTITQAIVSDVSGLPYEEYMLEKVLRPLGMTQSSFHQPPAPQLAPHLASAYDEKGEPVPGHYHLYPEQAAAGLWTTPSDLARLLISIQMTLRGEDSSIYSLSLYLYSPPKPHHE